MATTNKKSNYWKDKQRRQHSHHRLQPNLGRLQRSSFSWKDNRRYLLLVGAAVAASLALGLITFPAFVAVGSHTAEKELAAIVVEEVEEVQEIITVVDGVGCVMEPDMTFAKDTGYVTVTLVCDTDFLYNHLPAVEVEDE